MYLHNTDAPASIQIETLIKRCQQLEEKLDRVCTTMDQASELIQGDLRPFQQNFNIDIGAKMLDMLSMQIEQYLDQFPD